MENKKKKKKKSKRVEEARSTRNILHYCILNQLKSETITFKSLVFSQLDDLGKNIIYVFIEVIKTS